MTNEQLGRYEDALSNYQETIRVGPDTLGTVNLARAYRKLERRQEARTTLETLGPSGTKYVETRRELFTLAFLDRDQDRMVRQASAWAEDHADMSDLEELHRSEAAFFGRFQEHRQLTERWLATRAGDEAAANDLSYRAGMDAIVGLTKEVDSLVRRALSMPGAGVDTRMNAAWSLALAGNAAAAAQMAAAISTEYPFATLWHGVALPTIYARIELQKGNPAGALAALWPAARYDLAGAWDLFSVYTRGNVLLALGRGVEAAAEFQKILDHPGVAPFGVSHPLAHLGLGRARVLDGDKVAARKHYEDFLALWKNADQDLPILQEAKAEYEQLK